VTGTPQDGLAATDGATILASAAGGRGFAHTALADGDEVDLGGLRLRALTTPGHTDDHGNFFIKLVPGTPAPLTFARSGYETFTTTVSVRGDEAQTFRLIPKATVNIRTSAGASYDVDPETVEFGYVAPFTGYNKDTKLNLCKGGGESFMPDRTEIKRITGAAQLNDPKCCAQISIPAINVELKSGGTTTAGFVDACFGYKVDIVAQDHVTALPVYFHFTDLAEVTFP